jgi:hypothetical protein
MARNDKRFTVYDMMEAKGLFEANPANADSGAYAGPVAYPKMFYHPEGKMQITVPAELVQTIAGPRECGEQRALITRVAANAAEEKALVAEGWHDHPAKALAAAGLPVPPISPAGKIADLEAQIAALQAEKAMRQVAQDEIDDLKASRQ